MPNQNQNQFQCECGKEFSRREELQEHQKNCAMARSAKPMTKSAGGEQQKV